MNTNLLMQVVSLMLERKATASEIAYTMRGIFVREEADLVREYFDDGEGPLVSPRITAYYEEEKKRAMQAKRMEYKKAPIRQFGPDPVEISPNYQRQLRIE